MRRYHSLIKIIRASTGEQALNILHDFDKLSHPFVILLDLQLPGINGIEFLEQLRSEPEISDAKVIVLSGSSWPEHRESALNNQVIAYVNKSQLPGRIDRLARLFMRYLRKRVLRVSNRSGV